jgi:hypothetical protein
MLCSHSRTFCSALATVRSASSISSFRPKKSKTSPRPSVKIFRKTWSTEPASDNRHKRHKNRTKTVPELFPYYRGCSPQTEWCPWLVEYVFRPSPFARCKMGVQCCVTISREHVARTSSFRVDFPHHFATSLRFLTCSGVSRCVLVRR